MISELGFTPLFQIITPSTVQGEMDTVQNLSTQLGREIGNSSAPNEFKGGYAAFYTEWLAYRATHSDWITRGLSGTYEKVLEYKQRLADWQKRYEALGFRSAVEKPGSAGLKPFPWRSLAIGGGVALGLYFVLHSFLRSTRHG